MKASILAVDDNPVNLKLIAYLLEREGHRVIQARDAEEALERLAGSLPDLLLLDLGLPRMDGYTLCRMLRTSEETKHLWIVALTAHAMKGDDQKAYAAGFDLYITKPIDTRTFPAQINLILEKPGRNSR